MSDIPDKDDDNSHPDSGDPQPPRPQPHRRLWVAAQVAHIVSAITQVALLFANMHVHL
jgi:hypothetical protein